jgi:UDP-N-acetylglucosamine 2-epimerase (non-hydrolysing)
MRWSCFTVITAVLTAFTSTGATPIYYDKARVVVVLGTRPDTIKLAPVISALRTHFDDCISVFVLSSGQHKELLKPALDLFDITPDGNLDLMKYDWNDSAVFVARAIESMAQVIKDMHPLPRAMVVQGDTNTALAGAMAAFYNRIPVIHVEAGLRTWDISSPHPEEFNRRTISVIASLSLAPTTRSRDNLIQSGVSLDAIKVTGSTLIDSAVRVLDLPVEREAEFLAHVAQRLVHEGGVNRYVIVSSHPRENKDDGLHSIARAVRVSAIAHPDVVFLFISHRDRQPGRPVGEILANVSNVILLEPVEYSWFLRLLRDAVLVVTDSGGVQEEAAFLGVRCIALR